MTSGYPPRAARGLQAPEAFPRMFGEMAGLLQAAARSLQGRSAQDRGLLRGTTRILQGHNAQDRGSL